MQHSLYICGIFVLLNLFDRVTHCLPGKFHFKCKKKPEARFRKFVKTQS